MQTTEQRTVLTDDAVNAKIAQLTAAGDTETAALLAGLLNFAQQTMPILLGVRDFAVSLREEGVNKIASAAEMERAVAVVIPPQEVVAAAKAEQVKSN